MKILVVDDERSFGSLLSRALKRLGHQAKVAVHPEDALQMFREQKFDAVITDIDMPVMNGVELAERMRAERADIPIAFCTGSSPGDEAVERAATIGKVLPKVWTVADVRAVVEDLKIPRLARGSQKLPRQAASLEDDTLQDPNTPVAHRRKPRRKIKVVCRSWDSVERLCDGQSAGRNFLTVRGAYELKQGERVDIALSLPGELVLSVAAEVATVRVTTEGVPVYSIELTGLTPEICARLRSMSLSEGDAKKRSGNYRRVSKRAPTAPPAGDGQVIGNLRLRKQIDELGRKLKN